MKTFKISKLPKKAEGKYWYLYWVGGIIPYRSKMYTTFYFINTDSRQVPLSDFYTDSKCEIVLSCNDIILAPLGSFFDSQGTLIKRPNEMPNLSTIEFFAVENYNPTKKKIPFEAGKYPYPAELLNGDYYYFYFKSNTELGYLPVILPMFVFCNFFFFDENGITDLLITNRLDEAIDFDSIVIKEEHEHRIAEITYDDNLIDIDQLKRIGSLLFLKNNRGKIALNMIGSVVKDDLLKNKNVGYTRTFYPYPSQGAFKACGEFLELGNEKYFLAYEILSCSLVSNPFTIDEIVGVPKIPRDSTKDRKNHDVITVTRNIPVKSNKGNDDEVDLSPEIGSETGNKWLAKEKTKITANTFGLHIPTRKFKRDKQKKAYKVEINYVEVPISGSTTDLSNPTTNSDKQRLSASKVDPMQRIEYLRQVANILYKLHDIRHQFFHLENKFSEPCNFFVSYLGSDYNFIVIELNSAGRFFYLVEYDSGHTGFVYDLNFRPLSAIEFSDFLCHFIRMGQSWPKLTKNSYQFEERFNIRVLQGMTHPRKNYDSYEKIIEKTASKVMKRIKEAT